MNRVLVRAKDLDCGYTYAIHISAEQARAILDAAPGEEVSLGREGAWAYVEQKTISFRAGNGAGGGVSALDKRSVMRQINEQLQDY
ncbi:MAG TPA: hypothetical protein PKZ76_10065 [Xanthomonadaceae bacterium]|nr:hypothetical protein [Xanthomonadaceae bacterium]